MIKTINKYIVLGSLLVLLPNIFWAQAYNCTKYNDAYRKTSHNSYEPNGANDNSNSLAEVLNHTTSIEIDIYDDAFFDFTPITFLYTPNPGDWYVRHFNNFAMNNHPALLPHINDNVCGNGNENFGICLNDINTWSNNNPGHEVITLFIDKKQDWNVRTQGGEPIDLDATLTNIFGNKLYTIADFTGNVTTPRQAAAEDLWPTLKDVKGKIICVLTGSNDVLEDYVEDRFNNAVAFVAPTADDHNDIIINGQPGTPDGFDATSKQWVVFFNFDEEHNKSPRYTEDVDALNFVSRTYELRDNIVLGINPYAIELTDNDDFQAGINREVNFIAMHNFKETNFHGGIMQGPYINNANVTLPSNKFTTRYVHSSFGISQVASLTLKAPANNETLTIPSGSAFEMTAGISVCLKPGFYAHGGSNLDVFISSCGPLSKVSFAEANSDVQESFFASEAGAELEVFPNPSNGKFQLRRLPKNAVAEVISLDGKSLQTHRPTSESMELDLSHLTNGIYLLKVVSGNELTTRKLVKK